VVGAGGARAEVGEMGTGLEAPGSCALAKHTINTAQMSATQISTTTARRKRFNSAYS
jgi:hypothetical protein